MNRRSYTYEQYLQFKGTHTENDRGDIVIYARVSIKKQKDDLRNQITFLRQFCKVMENKIQAIVISSKDRFIRFGYDWFEKFCEKFNTKIIIVNNEFLSPN